MKYTKSKKIIEGKTKIIWGIKGNTKNVIIENKNDITAFDDPDFTKQFKTKAASATTVTSRVFELLKNAGIPVAFKEQISETEFVAPACEMIPLEVVSRRFAVGSFLKRHPELINENKNPHRFHSLEIEFFLKTTDGKLEVNKKTIIKGLDSKKGEEDPFIPNPYDLKWNLVHPKKPAWEKDVLLADNIEAKQVLKNPQKIIKEIEKITREVFLTLEGAWNRLDYRLIDMKIEFGIGKNGKLLVADVIDNDSWRLRNREWEELSKEAFRQGEKLDTVEKKYEFVASLTENFKVPEQVLVLWRGSESDDWPDVNILENIKNINIERITLSGHKSTRKALDILEDILGRYPAGGVILTKVGRSNGLGPIVAARTSWPVVTIPATIKNNPEDVWSSVRMPSNVPLATSWPESNAVLLAAQILGKQNPFVYKNRQLKIEEQDN